MLLLSQTEDKEGIANKKEDNNSENKEPKDMSLAEVMTVVIDPEITVKMTAEETDKIGIHEIIEEIQDETKDPENNLLYKAMLSAQQDSFLMSLLMTFWYLLFYLETRKRQENHQYQSFS